MCVRENEKESERKRVDDKSVERSFETIMENFPSQVKQRVKWAEGSERRLERWTHPKPSLGTNLKSTPWLPYSASTIWESFTASNLLEKNAMGSKVRRTRCLSERRLMIDSLINNSLFRYHSVEVYESYRHHVTPSISQSSSIFKITVSFKTNPGEHLMRRPSKRIIPLSVWSI